MRDLTTFQILAIYKVAGLELQLEQPQLYRAQQNRIQEEIYYLMGYLKRSLQTPYKLIRKDIIIDQDSAIHIRGFNKVDYNQDLDLLTIK